MAGISVEVRADRFPEVLARFPGAVDAVLSAGVERAAQYAQDHHPWQNQTGETEASVHMEQTGAHEFSLVAAGASLYLEYGTIHMPPYSFLRPAVAATAPSIISGFTKLESHL